MADRSGSKPPPVEETGPCIVVPSEAAAHAASARRFLRGGRRVPPVPLDQQLPSNFVLSVCNQSFAIDPVDIRVEIDGKTVVDREFEVGPQDLLTLRLVLSEGRHTLVAHTKRGSTKLETTFDVSGQHWAAVSFWFYPETHCHPVPKQFSCHIQDTPICFL